MAKHGRRPGAHAPGQSENQSGLVVASYGRHCVVETPDGERRICHPRGKRSQAVVGDSCFFTIMAIAINDRRGQRHFCHTDRR